MDLVKVFLSRTRFSDGYTAYFITMLHGDGTVESIGPLDPVVGKMVEEKAVERGLEPEVRREEPEYFGDVEEDTIYDITEHPDLVEALLRDSAWHTRAWQGEWYARR